MPASLYDALVPTWLQILNGTRTVLTKAESWCAEKGIAESDLLGARLIDDMFPFAFQIANVVNHSFGAVKGIREGVYSPKPGATLPNSIGGLRDMVDEAIAGLNAVTADEMDGFIGRDMRFSMPAMNVEMPFTAQDYLFSFAQPNFFFHAVTAYDILRSKGVPLGKRDYLGPVRLKAH